jgi:hypothetical protein
MCAPRLGARQCPSGTVEEPCVCRRFASDIFSFVLSFVMPGQKARSAVFNLKAPGIHAAVKHIKRFPPSVCLRHVSMDHRHRRPLDAVLRTAMPGGDESESAVTVAFHSSDAQPYRENEILFFLSPLCAERSDCAAIRVRGRGRESEPSGNAPSSQPSPRTRGEGARSRAARTKVYFSSPPLRGGGKTTDSEGAGEAQLDWLIGS